MLEIVPNFVLLIEIEAQAVRKNLIYLFILGFMAGVLLIGTWTCLMAMLFVYFISLHLSMMSALTIIFIIQISLLFFLSFMILNKKISFSFPKTRHFLRNLK